jgi:5'-deoxynucleotidase YfbR-like HD superfamily hydrolase
MSAKPWQQTYTGVQFFTLEPRQQDVRIEDIAHGLALINRFAGATRVPYSVAEHSVRVSQIVDHAAALHGLLHDASEFLLVDLPAPIKRQVAQYTAIETRLQQTICDRFGISSLLPGSVKHADLVLLATEKRDLLGPEPAPWDPLPDPLTDRIEPWPWQEAERRFLERFKELDAARKWP